MAEGHRVTLLSESAAAPAVTTPAAGTTSPQPRDNPAAARLPRPADLAVAAAALWWALPLTHALGGRDAGDEAILLALLGLATLLVRPWRALPRVAVILPCWVALAALVVPALAPTGWRGADDAAGYACAAMAFVVAAGWATSRARRLILAVALCLAALDQVLGALLTWWSQGSSAVVLSGTFFWHNPFAAYLMPAALIGVGLVTWRQRPLHLLGWVVTPVCLAGVVYSSSRATLALLAVGWVGCGLLAARRGDRVRALARSGLLAALSLGVTYAFIGPPFFSHRASPFAAAATRSADGETLAANGNFRVEFWKSALATFTRHPLVGSGYHGLVEASQPFTPTTYGRSNYAHNGYLQALSDGGLLLGIPVLLASGLLVWLAARTLLTHLRTGEGEVMPAVAAVALLAGMLHSAVDFDWSHSSLFVMDALVAALLVSSRVRRTSEPAGGHRGIAVAVIVVLGLGVAVGSLGARDANVGLTSSDPAPVKASRFTDQAERPLASDVSGRALLQLAVTTPGAVTASQRRRALAVTAREATIDLDLATLRAEVALTLGDQATAAAVLRRLEGTSEGLPSYSGDLGELLAADGQQARAVAVLRSAGQTALRDRDAMALGDLSAAFARVEGTGSPGAACLQRQLTTGTGCTPEELARS